MNKKELEEYKKLKSINQICYFRNKRQGNIK